MNLLDPISADEIVFHPTVRAISYFFGRFPMLLDKQIADRALAIAFRISPDAGAHFIDRYPAFLDRMSFARWCRMPYTRLPARVRAAEDQFKQMSRAFADTASSMTATSVTLDALVYARQGISRMYGETDAELRARTKREHLQAKLPPKDRHQFGSKKAQRKAPAGKKGR